MVILFYAVFVGPWLILPAVGAALILIVVANIIKPGRIHFLSVIFVFPMTWVLFLVGFVAGCSFDLWPSGTCDLL